MEEIKLCEYGCGKEAKFKLKNGKLCCSKSFNSCTKNKEISANSRRGKKRNPCSEETKNKIRNTKKLRSKKKTKENNKPELCEYGCGQEAKYYFKTVDKWCCSEFHTKCYAQRKKYGEKSKGHISWNRGKKSSQETIDKIKKNHARTNKGKHLSDETKRKISIGNSKPKNFSAKFKEEQRQRMLNGQALKMIKCIKKISNEEIKLRNMVKELYPDCEFQYSVFRYSLDVAIPEFKIAIEYDGFYHFENLRTREEYEYYINRRKRIEAEGWKFYRVTMFNKFPTLEIVKENLERLITG